MKKKQLLKLIKGKTINEIIDTFSKLTEEERNTVVCIDSRIRDNGIFNYPKTEIFIKVDK